MYLAGTSYYTYYKFITDKRSNIEDSQFVSNTACFSTIMNHYFTNSAEKIEYLKIDVYIFRDEDFSENHSFNNVCLITKNELNSILVSARHLVNFKYKIKSIDDYYYKRTEKTPVYVVSLEFENIYKIQYKYVLTWLRYAYEYPYNIALLDAIRLHRLKQYSKYTLPNLFQATTLSLPLSFGTGHACAIGSNFVSTNKLKEILTKNLVGSCLNSLYSGSHKNSYSNSGGGDERIPTDDISRESSFWRDEKNFERRISYYDKSINILNKSIKK